MDAAINWWNSQSAEVQAIIVGAILYAAQAIYTRIKGAPGLDINSPNNVKRGVAVVGAIIGALVLVKAGNVSGAIGVLVAAASALGASQGIVTILKALFPVPAAAPAKSVSADTQA